MSESVNEVDGRRGRRRDLVKEKEWWAQEQRRDSKVGNETRRGKERHHAGKKCDTK